MKNKGKILMGIGLAFGFIGTLLTSKSDELAREDMKQQIKSEVLSELQEERNA